MSAFVYVIFDKSTKFVLEFFKTEKECISFFNACCDEAVCDWKAINLHYVLKDFFEVLYI